MPVRLPKAGTDLKIWGLSLNDFLRTINGNILIALNGNNPPTVKAGSKFIVYKEDTYLTPTGTATGNNVYPADTNITYPVSEAMFEPADRTFAFADPNFPAAIGASKTYYLWCSGGEDINAASQGRGIYGMDETAPAWSELKSGWYNASGYRVLAKVMTTSGSIIDVHSLFIFRNSTTEHLIYEEILAANADPWTISGLDLNAHGGVYDIWLDVKAVTTDYLQMFVNGNFTTAQYRHHMTQRDNATISNGRADNAVIGYLDSSSNFPYRIILMTSAGCATGGVNAVMDVIDRNLYATTTWWSVTTNVTNVTSLTFDLINAKAIAAGSRIKIWKR